MVVIIIDKVVKVPPIPEEVVGNPSRSFTEIQVGKKVTIFESTRMALEISSADMIKYKVIVKNMSIFFFAEVRF